MEWMYVLSDDSVYISSNTFKWVLRVMLVMFTMHSHISFTHLRVQHKIKKKSTFEWNFMVRLPLLWLYIIGFVL